MALYQPGVTAGTSPMRGRPAPRRVGAPRRRPPAPGQVRTQPGQINWGAAIMGDPNVMAGMADIDLQQGRLGRQKQDAIRQAIIASGFIPEQAMGDLDEATLAAARQNRFSTAALLDDQRRRGSTDLASELGSRGMLGSGALAGGESMLQTDYEQASTQALQQLLGQLSGWESEYATGMHGLARERAGLREGAAQRLQADPRYRLPPGQALRPQAAPRAPARPAPAAGRLPPRRPRRSSGAATAFGIA
jgi:hypothetical protein